MPAASVGVDSCLTRRWQYASDEGDDIFDRATDFIVVSFPRDRQPAVCQAGRIDITAGVHGQILPVLHDLSQPAVSHPDPAVRGRGSHHRLHRHDQPRVLGLEFHAVGRLRTAQANIISALKLFAGLTDTIGS